MIRMEHKGQLTSMLALPDRSTMACFLIDHQRLIFRLPSDGSKQPEEGLL